MSLKDEEQMLFGESFTNIGFKESNIVNEGLVIKESPFNSEEEEEEKELKTKKKLLLERSKIMKSVSGKNYKL
jgi:hypothetical protein